MGSSSPDRLEHRTTSRRTFLAQAAGFVGLATSLGTAGGASAQEASPRPKPEAEGILGLTVEANGNIVPSETAGILLAPERMVAGGLEINNFVPGHGAFYDDESKAVITEKVGDRNIIINVTQTGQPLEGYSGERAKTHTWFELRAPELILPPGSTVNGITYPDEMTEGSFKYGEATIDLTPEGAYIINYNLGPNYQIFAFGPLPNLPTPDTAKFAERRRERAGRELSQIVMYHLEYGGLPLSWPTVPSKKSSATWPAPREDLAVFIVPSPLLQLH